MPDKYISNWMLQAPMRQYVIDKIKAPMLKAIVILSKRYPEPKYDNCVQPNSHVLIDIRDKFLQFENNPMRAPLFGGLWRMFIDEYEHDPYYKDRIDFIVEELVKAFNGGRWQPRKVGKPNSHWKEFSLGGNQC